MKRILISLLISFSILVTIGTLAIGLESLGLISEETSMNAGIPFRLPVYIYEDILGFETPYLEEEDDFTVEQAWLLLYYILFDIIMYGVIIYFIIGFLSKFKRRQETILNDEPPEPPVFE